MTSCTMRRAQDYGADALVELPMDVSKPDEVSDVGGTQSGGAFVQGTFAARTDERRRRRPSPW